MILQDPQDYLTNSKYLLILELVGLSKQPLLSKEIRRKLLGIRGDDHLKIRQNISYLYDMLRLYLAPSSYRTRTFRIIQWKNYPSHQSQMKKLISKLNLLLSSLYCSKVKFEELDGSVYFSKERPLTFQQISDEELIIFQKNVSELSIIIKLDDIKQSATLDVIIDGKLFKTDDLLVRNNKDRIFLYALGYIPAGNLPRFLFATKFSNSDKRTIKEMYQDIRSSPLTPITQKNEFELLFALDNTDDEVEVRQLCKYRLNIRGLLALILKIMDEEKLGRNLNTRISRLLRHLSDHYLEDFPFLLYYREFEKEYIHMEKSGFPIRNFPVKLMKQIAMELNYLVYGSTDIRHLMYWVIRQFSRYILSNFSSRKLKNITIEKINRYRARTLHLIKEYLTYAALVTEADYNETLSRL